jgi:hypothetical protein
MKTLAIKIQMFDRHITCPYAVLELPAGVRLERLAPLADESGAPHG